MRCHVADFRHAILMPRAQSDAQAIRRAQPLCHDATRARLSVYALCYAAAVTFMRRVMFRARRDARAVRERMMPRRARDAARVLRVARRECAHCHHAASAQCSLMRQAHARAVCHDISHGAASPPRARAATGAHARRAIADVFRATRLFLRYI